MNLSLLVQLCGIPLLVVLGVLGLLLTATAIYLALGVKRVPLLIAFLPLTSLPIMAGLLSAFLDTISSIGMQLDPTSQLAADPGFLLLMNMVPLLTGIVVAIPAALITIVARWALTWKASGLHLLPKKAEIVTTEEDESNEAQEYLRQLVRPR